MLTAVITEKTMKLAASGKYTFLVDPRVTKGEARKLIENTFGVKVVSIASIAKRASVKRSMRGRKKITPAQKKVIVKLAAKDKIDLFEEKKK